MDDLIHPLVQHHQRYLRQYVSSALFVRHIAESGFSLWRWTETLKEALVQWDRS